MSALAAQHIESKIFHWKGVGGFGKRENTERSERSTSSPDVPRSWYAGSA